MQRDLSKPLLRTLEGVRVGLTSIIRWQRFVNVLPIRRETCLEHSFDTVLLAIVVSEVVRTHAPTRQFDPYNLVACAALHDVGEIITGDIPYADRAPGDAKKEAHAFQRIFNWLPEEARRSVNQIYAIQNEESAEALELSSGSDSTSLLFEFIERYGYLIYALEQVHADPQNLALLRHVLSYQLARLRYLMAFFPELLILLPISRQNELEEAAYAYSDATN